MDLHNFDGHHYLDPALLLWGNLFALQRTSPGGGNHASDIARCLVANFDRNLFQRSDSSFAHSLPDQHFLPHGNVVAHGRTKSNSDAATHTTRYTNTFP